MVNPDKDRIQEAQQLLEAKDKGLLYHLPCPLGSDIIVVHLYNDYLADRYIYSIAERKMTLDMLARFDEDMVRDRQQFFFPSLQRAIDACAKFAASCPGLGKVMRYGSEAIQKAAEAICCGKI